MKALVRTAGIAAAVVALCLSFTSSALAHATYKSSNPPDKGSVSSPPSEITAEFTEPMTGGSYMDVTDPCGRDVGSGSEQTGSSMRVQNSGTAAGTYVVFWRAASIDGHITEGEFVFTSSGGEPCPGEEEPEDPGTGGSGSGGGGNTDPGDASIGEEEAVAGGSAGGAGGGSGGGDGSTQGAPSKGRHGKHSNMKRHGGDKGGNADRGSGPLAQSRDIDVPDAPSALEGLPIDGLLMTLGVAALIGAAAGKIYVSLSGDDS